MEDGKHGTIKYLRKAVIVLLWAVLWQLVSLLVKNPLFFPGPLQVARELAVMCREKEFYVSIAYSLFRILSGFGCAFLAAYLLALLAGRFSLLEEIFSPVIHFCKSVPVASIIVLLLIWTSSELLAFYISFMVVFPLVYINVLEGIRNTPGEMLQMAQVFQLSVWRRYIYILRPSVWEHLHGALKIAVGMSFKSGVAAEVIGLTRHSIGERLYFNKIFINSAGVFGWTFVIILLSVLSEKGILFLFEKAANVSRAKKLRKEAQRRREIGEGALDAARMPAKAPKEAGRKNRFGDGRGTVKEKPEPESCGVLESIKLTKLTKRYADKTLFENLDAEFLPDNIYGLMGESGQGKTTLFQIIAGLAEPDGGEVQRPERVSMQFQEERLIDWLSAVENILLVLGRNERMRMPEKEAVSGFLQGKEVQGDGKTGKESASGSSAKESGYACADSRETACFLAEKVLGESWAYQPVSKLSGGMRRRVSLLRALLKDSDILILDEPFNGLDDENKRMMLELIKLYGKNRIVLIASHDREDLEYLTNQILVLE